MDNIKDLKTGMKNLNMHVIVLEQVGNRHITKDNHEIRTYRVADRTGSINLCIWDEAGLAVAPSDILRITRSYVASYKGCPTVYIGRGGRVMKVGEFCFLFSELPYMSEDREINRQQQQQQPLPNLPTPQNSVQQTVGTGIVADSSIPILQPPSSIV
ncbi:SOSS complex subunit B1 [Blomia tropicalis]|nr:SOSS complex subunit B1 [Blomia tropicalis]